MINNIFIDQAKYGQFFWQVYFVLYNVVIMSARVK